MEEIKYCAKGLGNAAEALLFAITVQTTTAGMLILALMLLN